MKFILKVGFIFIALNLFISTALYIFVSNKLGLESLFLISYFSMVWLLIEFLTLKAHHFEIDIISIGLGLRIGLKFFLSLGFIGFMIWSQTFIELGNALLFIMYYFVYTFAMFFIKVE